MVRYRRRTLKRLILALIVALTLTVATVAPALAVTLILPNGDTVEGLPDGAANAAQSGVVDEPSPECDPPPCSD